MACFTLLSASRTPRHACLHFACLSALKLCTIWEGKDGLPGLWDMGGGGGGDGTWSIWIF